MAVSLVQTTHGTNTTGSTSTTSTSAFASANTAGNAIIVAIANDGSSGSVTSVTDTAGNTYTRAIEEPSSGDTVSCEIWYCLNVKAQASNVVTANQGFNDGVIWAQEWSGLATSSGLDQTKGAKGTATAASTGASSTTMQASELVFVAGELDVSGSNSLSVGSGYSNFNSASSGTVIGAIESKVVSATGAQTGAMTSSASGVTWRLALATFKAASGSTLNHGQFFPFF